MPTMSIYISPRGTSLAEGGSSAVGHMYFSLTESNGTTYSYGFAPAEHGTAFGEGKVYTNDTSNYQGYSQKRDFSISESQFQQVLSWAEVMKVTGGYGDYRGVGNNCITFTFDAMKQAGLNPTYTPLYHDWWPNWNRDNVDNIWYDYLRRPEFNKELNKTSPTSSTYRIVYVDPLAIDLDGDGIETVAANGHSGALFDGNSDGIRTATGWLSGDDAWLVRDLNGDGLINNGSELFGDQTLLANGQKAANGIAALAQHDGNHDGKIDALDAIYSELRIWQDSNGNGITDTGDLQTLQALGIQSIGVQSSTPNATGTTTTAAGSYANNQIVTVTRTDGSTTTATDLNLSQDNFNSRYIDQIEIPEALRNLPNLAGMGRLRDLKQAAALSPALADKLTEIVIQQARRKKGTTQRLAGLTTRSFITEQCYEPLRHS